jgi:glycine/D-amino acid oxidase-like deaminating enzyme
VACNAVCLISRSCYKAGVNSADVVIVGGGFAGMATAWALLRRGTTSVIVLEREPELGRYASGRSAGMGRQLAEDDALTALTVRGAALLRECFADAWSPTGGVLSFDNLDHAGAYAERAARFGVLADPIERDRVLRHWPELMAVEIATALHLPSDGIIDVQRLLAMLAAGVDVRPGVAVESAEAAPGGGARLVTSAGVLQARLVVDATGAWAGRTTGDPLLPSHKRHVYVLEAAPAGCNGPFVWHLGACELYVRETDGAIMCSPCDAVPTLPGDQQPDEAGEGKLRRAFAGSPLERAGLRRAWACQRTFARGLGMQLGRDPERPWLLWAAGLGGHGATAAAAVGETVAAAIHEALGV